jgi:integrase
MRGLPRQVKGARTQPSKKRLRTREAQDLVP